jgi:hypothetical protein
MADEIIGDEIIGSDPAARAPRSRRTFLKAMIGTAVFAAPVITSFALSDEAAVAGSPRRRPRFSNQPSCHPSICD